MPKEPIVPFVGYRVFDGLHRYVVAEVKPYTRATDGQPTTLVTLEGECAHCGVPFFQTVSLTTKALNRRCAHHKRPGTKAKILTHSIPG